MRAATGTSPTTRKRSKVTKSISSKARQRTTPSPDDWSAWCDYLRTRRKPRSLDKLIPKLKSSVLTWPLDDSWHGSLEEKQIRLLERLGRRESSSNAKLLRTLEDWLDASPRRSADPVFGIECIAWCHALPALAQSLPAAPWSQLLENLELIAEEAVGLSIGEQPLTQQLLAGELPFTLGFTFPELSQSKKLLQQASKQLSDGIVELLDGEGLLAARHLQYARPLLACWTRCGYLGREAEQPAFNEEGRTQFEWFVLQVLRLTRPDGSHVFSEGLSGAYCGTLFEAALTLTGDRSDRRVADALLPRRQRSTTNPPQEPSPAVNSEWAEVAVLRRGWTRSDDQLAVTYHGQQMAWELSNGNHSFWSGQAIPEIKLDGQLLGPAGDWSEICWISNQEADYLELEIQLADRKLQRQILLARQDRFLFIADALLGDDEATIEYRHALPLGRGIEFQAASETREGYLVAQRRLAAVLPLALPEWRAERTSGQLSSVDQQLELSLKKQGRRLYAPLFVDLDSTRIRRQLTWRRLTVAEKLEVQPADVAAGYRVQVGARQWMFYRSLERTTNRSLLGQNICSEFIASRFTANGESEHLVEIED